MAAMTDVPVMHHEAESRFTFLVDADEAELTYRRSPGSISFLHTGVPQHLRGRGIGGRLVKAGLEFAREKGLSVVPLCPFVSGWIQRHPEHLELVREDFRARLGR